MTLFNLIYGTGSDAESSITWPRSFCSTHDGKKFLPAFESRSLGCQLPIPVDEEYMAMKNSAGGGALSPTRGAAAGTIDVFCGASAPSSALPGSTRSRHWPHYAARRSKNHWPHCAQRVICAACRRCPSP